MILRPVTTEWRRELAGARKRAETRSARISSTYPTCPLCGKPGPVSSYPDGKIYRHKGGFSCWVPQSH